MTLITAARIAALAPHVAVTLAEQLAAAMATAMPQFGLESPLQIAHFMGQACHESTGFTRLVESLRYTDPEHLDEVFSLVRGISDASALIAKGPEAIANRVYAYRNGNGGESTGDGWRYRGRGLFQLTGRTSYDRAARDLGHPYDTNPDLVAQPEGAALTALWFWKQNHCSAAADKDDVSAVTRIINGPAMAGLTERVALTERAKAIFT